MSVTIVSVDSLQIGVADTTLYLCPANTKARVVACTICNDTTTVPTFNINKVPFGWVVAVTNLLINTQSLGSRTSRVCPEIVGQILNGGDFLSGIASVAAQITISLSVVEVV